MQEKRIIITGASGCIGRLLTAALGEFDQIPVDLPGQDVRDYQTISSIAKGADVIVHLAWNSAEESAYNQGLQLENIRMAQNVYQAAIEHSIPRVIMASSVHVDMAAWKPMFVGDHSTPVPTTYGPVPSSPYGASKLMIEALGRHYASCYSLEVICIRLGGVWIDARSFREIPNNRDRFTYLSSRDLIGVVRQCLTCELAEPYHHFYAVSGHVDRVHDTNNKIGWVSTYTPDA